jgi:hypothetical protein
MVIGPNMGSGILAFGGAKQQWGSRYASPRYVTVATRKNRPKEALVYIKPYIW